MSLAANAREAARRHPFLLLGIRAGVVNYTAAARFLDVDGDVEAVATALRRFGEELPELDFESRDARVTMKSGLGFAEEDAGLLAVGGAGVVPDAGSLTGILAHGEVDAAVLSGVLARLLAAGVDVEAAGVAGETLLVVVGRRDGATTVRVVEDVLEGTHQV